MAKRWRRLRMGLQTLLGAPRGFFIPYRYAEAIAPADVRAPYAPLEALFRHGEPALTEHLAAVDGLAADLQAIGAEAPPPEPRWAQGWFPRLDAAAGYAMVRRFAPPRLVEVGSGHSTRFYVRAARDGATGTAITAIDPAPRADISRLDGVAVIRDTVQRAGPAPFADLRAGDVLAIDSSHILMPGTDVDLLLNRVLPALPAGVIVHIHDMFLPDPYPASWAWRGYNEQQAVAALLGGGGYEVLWSSRYAATRLADRLAETVVARLPHFQAAPESSLWLRKTAPGMGPDAG